MTDLDKALAFFDKADAQLNDDVVPKGFFTAKQIAAKRGGDRQYLKAKLDAMFSRGLAERREFKVGGTRSAYYRIKG